MRRFKRPDALLGALIIALCSLLVACGVTEPSGTAGEATSAPGTTVVITSTAGSVHAVPSSSASPTAAGRSATPMTPGEVRLVLDKTSYAPGSAATVTIENGLSAQIPVTDHHTSCTYVQLEQLVVGEWQPVGLCKLMTPIRLVELAAGSVISQRINIPTGPDAAGTYRVALKYGNSTAYSTTFTVE
jgi:hypothetical protein